MGRLDRINLRLWLLPFSWLYGLAVGARNLLYNRGLLSSTGFETPLISVGNITAGGTGKTPQVEYLVELLRYEYRVATLSRGYKRRTRDFRLVSPSSAANEVGDEPLQLKQKFPEITVAVDRKRVHGVRTLMTRPDPPEVIILDDAFQHRSVIPGYSILLVDHARPIHKDFLLPAGMLREPAANLKRAQMVVVTRCPEEMDHQEQKLIADELDLPPGMPLFFTSTGYGKLIPVYRESRQEDRKSRDGEWYREHAGGVLLITGISRPEALELYARSISSRVNHIRFPDHHHYRIRDIRRIADVFRKLSESWKNLLVLTTEKDAVKLRQHDPGPGIREALYAVRIHVSFKDGKREQFNKLIKDYVSSNQRSSRLHQGQDRRHS